MHSQECDRSLMFVFHIGKSVTVFVFIHFSQSLFVGARAFKTTRVEDTELTLEVTLF